MVYRFDEHGKGYRVGKTLISWRPQYETIISWVNRGSKVLDVGCGDGVLGARLMKEKSCSVYGFDLDPIAVKEARRKDIVARVHDADYRFPYRTNQFDVILCNELLEFVTYPNHVVFECLRVGKKAIIEFPNFGFWFYRLQFLFGRFPTLALYGHAWWETLQSRFFSYNDFLRLPALKNVTILRRAGIDWKNREVGLLATCFSNTWARSVILEILK